MHVYYYFFVQIKDKNVEVIEDSSICHMRLNKQFHSLYDRLDENSCYILLKGIDDPSCFVNDHFIEMFLKKREKSKLTELDLFSTVLQSFDFCFNSYDKYLSIAQYPLLVIRTKDKRTHIVKPRTPKDVFSHCFIHFYQFLKVKQLHDEEEKIKSLIRLSNNKYAPGIHPSSRFVTCCLNNILIRVADSKIFLLKHECHRRKNPQNNFDHNLFNAVSELLQ